MSKVALVTGANRGLGLQLVRQLAEAGYHVYGSVRNPSNAKDLQELAASSSITIVKIDGEADTKAAAALIAKERGRLDLVIANAGISNSFKSAETVALDVYRDHWQVNFLNVVMLYQATIKLLLNSAEPKFVGISTVAGSIGNMAAIDSPTSAYGSSKAALNYFLMKVRQENAGKLTVIAISPGYIASDMGIEGAKVMGVSLDYLISPETSAKGVLSVVMKTNYESSGTLKDYTDEEKWAW
jgi:NAD(P)-dependent dehydrogenase (short-subunit alcohol dehydrogenase family)